MKRDFGEEFTLPYPNIRTKEGYVMKKRILALALSLVVIVSVSACDSSESSANKQGKNISSTDVVSKFTLPVEEVTTLGFKFLAPSTLETKKYENGAINYFYSPGEYETITIGVCENNYDVKNEKEFVKHVNDLGKDDGSGFVPQNFKVITTEKRKNSNGLTFYYYETSQTIGDGEFLQCGGTFPNGDTSTCIFIGGDKDKIGYLISDYFAMLDSVEKA